MSIAEELDIHVTVAFEQTGDLLSSPSQFIVHGYVLLDRLNAIPELLLESHLETEGPQPQVGEIAGRRARVTFEEPWAPSFDGIVRRAANLAVGDPKIVGVPAWEPHRLTLVPPAWLTTQRAGHRIFQGRNALEIVRDVLTPYGGAVTPPVGRILQHALPTYDYRVQSGETDHDFLFRILSEHGLVSYWAPGEDGQSRWIVTDDTTIGGPDIEVGYRPPGGALGTSGPHVSAVRSGAELCTSEAQLRDYDARKPGYPLDRRTLAGDASKVEEPLARYSFAVGRFDDDEGGDLLAQRRLEQSRTASRTYQWEVSFPVRAGMRIRLREHPQDDANGDFLVVAARTEVNPARKTRKHIAEVVPASVPWRPEVLPKPRIQGHQTAFVAGAPGKEIDVDAEGRIAVRFHWDTRKEGVSRRVRVATPWMGTNRGFWTLPRVGDEVVVAYLDGDPDQPLVVGSVNNAVAPPAATLPKYETQSWWKSKSTGNGDGYNAILMEDQEGQEALALRAERDFFSETGRRSEVYVGENQIVRVGGSQTVMVGGGQSTGAGNVSLATGGEYKVHSKGDMEISCDGSRSDTTSAFHSIGAQNLTLTGASAALLVGGNVSIVANDGAITLTAGGSSIEVGPAGIKIASNADVAINGAFLKLNC